MWAVPWWLDAVLTPAVLSCSGFSWELFLRERVESLEDFE